MSEDLFQVAFEHAPIGLAIMGIDDADHGRFLHTNPALARMLGREPGELDGVLARDVTHPEDIGVAAHFFRDSRSGSHQAETRYMHRDGRPIWTLITATAVPGVNGAEAEYCVTQVLDISERKRFEVQLRHLADHDPLTGLLNRRSFETELVRALEEARCHDRAGALLVLDLDGFKFVNDRFGHAVGDELLIQIGLLLRQCAHEGDLIARLGGDEFAIVARDCTLTAAVALAERILAMVRSRGVVGSERATARVTTSVGIVPLESHVNATADELEVAADTAMYRAKRAGRNGYAVHTPAAAPSAVSACAPAQPGAERTSWFARLRRALDEERFVLHAQPIVPICGAGPCRYELLLRMRGDEDGELVPPRAFLFDAERFDLIGEIDRWVLRRAVQLLHAHAAAGQELSLTVNLSAKTIDDLGVVGDLAQTLSEYPVPAGRLTVEVTETAAIVNIDRVRELAHELHKLGCGFALDDFGAGLASFYYLKQLEFDYLKIDGEFITKLLAGGVDRLLVEAVVGIARGLGTQTVAEFVGDDATVEVLRRLGVDYGQGFHLGRPGPLETVLPCLPVTPDWAILR